MTGKKTVVVHVVGALKDAIETLSAELAERDDVFEKMTDAEVCRRLLGYAVREQRSGRGPWPTR